MLFALSFWLHVWKRIYQRVLEIKGLQELTTMCEPSKSSMNWGACILRQEIGLMYCFCQCIEELAGFRLTAVSCLVK